MIENLCINAVEAMNSSGSLHISISKVFLDDISELLPASLKLKPGAYLKLSVADTGCGMDKATEERIFDPYFTTKNTKRKGLGLAAVHGIVKQHEGAINVQSELGKGTTLDVYIPRIEKGAEMEARACLSSSQKAEQILLVEDEEMGAALLVRHEVIDPVHAGAIAPPCRSVTPSSRKSLSPHLNNIGGSSHYETA
ncbi:MAG: ATP-binding protein [Syntrophobacteraceae bacterium]